MNIFRLKMFLVPNIRGPKFLLDLSHHLHSIQVQNTFLTDSKQIQKILEFFFDQNIFGRKNVFGPKHSWTQISSRP